MLSYFDYCSTLWDTCSKKIWEKLQTFQNRAARGIIGANHDVPSIDVLESLGWDKVDKSCSQNKAHLIYKILNYHAAPNLNKTA